MRTDGKLNWKRSGDPRIVWESVEKFYPTQKSWIVRENLPSERLVIVAAQIYIPHSATYGMPKYIPGFAVVFKDQLPAAGNEPNNTLCTEETAEDCKRVMAVMVCTAELGQANTARCLNQR